MNWFKRTLWNSSRSLPKPARVSARKALVEVDPRDEEYAAAIQDDGYVSEEWRKAHSWPCGIGGTAFERIPYVVTPLSFEIVSALGMTNAEDQLKDMKEQTLYDQKRFPKLYARLLEVEPVRRQSSHLLNGK